MLANKKWTIQGPLDVFVDLTPGSKEGDDIVSAKDPVKPHQWIIKHHTEDARSYRLAPSSLLSLHSVLDHHGVLTESILRPSQGYFGVFQMVMKRRLSAYLLIFWRLNSHVMCVGSVVCGP